MADLVQLEYLLREHYNWHRRGGKGTSSFLQSGMGWNSLLIKNTVETRFEASTYSQRCMYKERKTERKTEIKKERK